MNIYRIVSQQFLVFMLSLMLSLSAKASFDKALELYQQGKFFEAKEAFEALASLGNRNALFNLGVMHFRGEAVARDPVKASAFMQYAASVSDDPNILSVSQRVFAALSPSEQQSAKVILSSLENIYSDDAIKRSIFPKLLDDEDCPPEVQPIHQERPKYPSKELRDRLMGLTYVEMTISPEGYSRDVFINGTTTRGFGRSTANSLNKFVFEPPADKRPVYGYEIAFIYMIAGDDVEVKTKYLKRDMQETEAKAQQGDPIAQYQYGQKLNAFRKFDDYLNDVDLQYRTANEWYQKSALQGLPNAQYQIGRNMMRGRGCEIDKKNGQKWINLAAVSGYSPAQTQLAKILLFEQDESTEQSIKSAMHWLSDAAVTGNPTAIVLLAWELSTSALDEVRDAGKALKWLDSDFDDYFDELRILETQAAAYAELGEFHKAIKYQKKALKLANKRDWEIPLVAQRLSLYQDQKPYRGSYY